MTIEQERAMRREYQQQLAKLIIENPQLDVIPMVDYEIVCSDDYRRWASSIGQPEIHEYYFDISDEGQLCYKDKYNEEELEYINSYLHSNNMEWKKAIFVDIDLPVE